MLRSLSVRVPPDALDAMPQPIGAQLKRVLAGFFCLKYRSLMNGMGTANPQKTVTRDAQTRMLHHRTPQTGSGIYLVEDGMQDTHRTPI